MEIKIKYLLQIDICVCMYICTCAKQLKPNINKFAIDRKMKYGLLSHIYDFNV